MPSPTPPTSSAFAPFLALFLSRYSSSSSHDLARFLLHHFPRAVTEAPQRSRHPRKSRATPPPSSSPPASLFRLHHLPTSPYLISWLPLRRRRPPLVSTFSPEARLAWLRLSCAVRFFFPPPSLLLRLQRPWLTWDLSCTDPLDTIKVRMQLSRGSRVKGVSHSPAEMLPLLVQVIVPGCFPKIKLLGSSLCAGTRSLGRGGDHAG